MWWTLKVSKGYNVVLENYRNILLIKVKCAENVLIMSQMMVQTIFVVYSWLIVWNSLNSKMQYLTALLAEWTMAIRAIISYPLWGLKMWWYFIF